MVSRASTVRAAALSTFIEVAREVGLDGPSALRRFGFDLAILRDPDAHVPAPTVAALLEYAALESGQEAFGLLMAERRAALNLGPLGLVLAHQNSLRGALATLTRHRRLLNDALTLHVEDIGDAVVVSEDIAVGGLRHPRQSYELAIAVLLRMCGVVLGPRWRPLSVHFSHTAPNDVRVHRRVFGPSVLFGCDFNGFVCAVADVDRPNPASDPQMVRYAQQYVDTLPRADGHSTVADVHRAIHVLLPERAATIEKVAAYLGVQVRTLQRRLEAEGGAFAGILRDVRRDLAMRCLAEPETPLTRVASQLGYGQLSSFSRWFLSEFGVSPSDWRRAGPPAPPLDTDRIRP